MHIYTPYLTPESNAWFRNYERIMLIRLMKYIAARWCGLVYSELFGMWRNGMQVSDFYF